MSTSDSFYNRLREAFRGAGLSATQVDIASALGIQQASISKWKKGINFPKLETLMQITELTGVNLEWLQTGRGPKRQKTAGGATENEVLRIIDTFRQLSPSGRAATQAFADFQLGREKDEQ